MSTDYPVTPVEPSSQTASTKPATNENGSNRPATATKSRLQEMKQRLAAPPSPTSFRRRSRRGFYFAIPTNQQAQAHAHETHGKDSNEHKALAFLHQQWVQSTLAGLLLLDVILLFIELALLTLYPSCNLIERDAISCCPFVSSSGVDDDNNNNNHQVRILAAGGGSSSSGTDDGAYNNHENYYCSDPDLIPMEEYEVGCDEHKWSKVHSVENALFYMTISILGIFLLELLVTMWAIKPWVFFRHLFYALDFIIVSVSIALEATFHVLDDTVLATMIGLLILGRIWRFVRIGHGVMEFVSNMNRKHYEELWAYAEELEQKLKDHNIELSTSHKKPAHRSSSHGEDK